MEKTPRFITHPPEEMLEEYCFNRLPEDQTAALEDHLLACAHCQLELQDLDEYILVMKLATQELAMPSETLAAPQRWAEISTHEVASSLAGDDGCSSAERNIKARPGTRSGAPRQIDRFRWRRFRPVIAKPRLITSTVCATGLGLTCVLGLLLLRSSPAEATTAVSLSAFRGGGDALAAHAPASRPLDLQADISDLPGADASRADAQAATAYRLEVVDMVGKPVWDQIVPVDGGTLSGHLTKGLPKGVYWVRLYSRSGELVREFSLRLDAAR